MLRLLADAFTRTAQDAAIVAKRADGSKEVDAASRAGIPTSADAITRSAARVTRPPGPPRRRASPRVEIRGVRAARTAQLPARILVGQSFRHRRRACRIDPGRRCGPAGESRRLGFPQPVW